jgi:hypothetical protein
MTGRTLRTGAFCAAVVLALIVGKPHLANAAEDYGAQIEAVKKAVEKYKDVYAAVHDGYWSTIGCVHYDGKKLPGHVDYDKGAMGVHFVKFSAVGPTFDPMNPPVLVYQPAGAEFKLVAVEYLVPLAPGMKRPTLFGHDFQGPMEGHEPLIPQAFHHYDIHFWLIDNPYGQFAPTNPNVKCDDYHFSLLEEPTLLVPAN